VYLASLGYDIAVHYNSSKDEARKTADYIKSKDVACELFKADLSYEKDILELVPKAVKKFPGLNLLVNNASVFMRSHIRETSFQLMDRHFNVNFKAPYLLSRDFSANVKNGNIINILDTKAAKDRSIYAAYVLSKKALLEFTRMAALEFAPDIRVNGIAPGLILPPEGENDDYLDNLAKKIPLAKKGSVNNVTQSIRLLIDNDFLTGQVIYCDGGEHLRS
jgi:NAD(P)-dependent dehydrogenase (short-subunit alcohol dehydrogenase family)